ncbi:MAG TPA: hypothetical protein VEA78_05320, partial [Acidimicrobiales bacterium]|nr:hypothetical protein [Acidimicrobiales bacterium]
IAAVVAAQHLPWLLAGLVWRHLPVPDRRTVVGLVHTARALVVAYLGFHAAAGTETILKIQLGALVLGAGEALAGRVEEEREDTDRLSARGMLGVALVGMPLGGFLYELFLAVPFVANVLFFALAGLFALFVDRPVRAVDAPVAADHDRQRVPLALAVSSVATAVAGSAVLGVLVLFALDDLGLGAPAFGLLLAGLAGATAAGGWVAPETGRALGLKLGAALAALVAGAALVTAARVADAERPWAAVVALGIAWATATTGRVLLRALVPAATTDPANLRTLHLLEWAGIVAGALAGGWFAREQGVADVLPFAAAAYGVAALAVAGIRRRTVNKLLDA